MHEQVISFEEIDCVLKEVEHLVMDGQKQPNQWVEHEKFWVCRKLGLHSPKLPRIDAVTGPGKYILGGERMIRAITANNEIVEIHDDCYVPGGHQGHGISLKYKQLKAARWKGIAIYAKLGYKLSVRTDAEAHFQKYHPSRCSRPASASMP